MRHGSVPLLACISWLIWSFKPHKACEVSRFADQFSCCVHTHPLACRVRRCLGTTSSLVRLTRLASRKVHLVPLFLRGKTKGTRLPRKSVGASLVVAPDVRFPLPDTAVNSHPDPESSWYLPAALGPWRQIPPSGRPDLPVPGYADHSCHRRVPASGLPWSVPAGSWPDGGQR